MVRTDTRCHGQYSRTSEDIAHSQKERWHAIEEHLMTLLGIEVGGPTG